MSGPWVGFFSGCTLLLGCVCAALVSLVRNQNRPYWRKWEPVTMPRPVGAYEFDGQIAPWLSERCQGKWIYVSDPGLVDKPTFYFKRKNDAFEFKMRWY